VKLLITSAVLLALVQAASAQTIWRCGSSYSEVPCPAGTSLEAPQPRPATDIQAAQRSAESERLYGEQLRAERLQREGPRGSGVAGFGPKKPAVKKPGKAKQRQPEAPDTFRAVAPSSRRAKG
jgi:hypothetical protein